MFLRLLAQPTVHGVAKSRTPLSDFTFGGAEWSKHSLGRAHPTRAGVAEAAALPSEGALQVGWVKRTLQALRFLYQRHERARHLLQAGSSGGHVC